MNEAELLCRFEQLIRARCGIQMRAQEASTLARTLRERTLARRFASAQGYLDFLAEGTAPAQDEWTLLFGLLTNQESYFFRDELQLKVIREQLLPALMRRNAQTRTLRIWSAGCSTGEEPYSLAMMMEDVLPARQGWRVLILGTDISQSALARARRGVYGAWSFRVLSDSLRARFFDARGAEWEVKPQLRERVVFQNGNLFDDPFPCNANELHDMDLIVCRNVFIYFGRDEVAQVLRKFNATLCPEGYLVAGHAELQGVPLGDLQANSFPQSVVYGRRAAPPHEVRDIGRRVSGASVPVSNASTASLAAPKNAAFPALIAPAQPTPRNPTPRNPTPRNPTPRNPTRRCHKAHFRHRMKKRS